MEVQSALGPLSDRFTDVKYTVTEEDREMVYNLAEDIRNAIFEYQVSRRLWCSWLGGFLRRQTVFTTEGNLRAEP